MSRTAIPRSTREALRRSAAIHEACAEPARLRLLNLLAGGELCVCDLQDLTGASQPFVSRHLARLRKAGLVEVERRRKFAYYRLAVLPPPHQRLLDTVLQELAAADAPLRKARASASATAARRGTIPCD